jgi:hypothetical protein
MTQSRWEPEWRTAEPLPDFARRVVLEHERQEHGTLAVTGSARRRYAGKDAARKHTARLVVLGLAALLISGAAAASLGQRWQPRLHDMTQEGAPIEQPERRGPLLLRVSLPAPMEREKATVPEHALPASPKAKPAGPLPVAPARPVPVHYPACHCSSGAVVCSCVD